MPVKKTKVFALFFFLFYFLGCYTSKPTQSPILSILMAPTPSSPFRITIVGDSLSEWSRGFRLGENLGQSYSVTNLGRAGWDTELWLQNLSEARAVPTDLYLIALGTNDASYRGGIGFSQRFDQLVDSLQRTGLRGFLVSTVPLTNQMGLRPAIQSLNQEIRGKKKSNQIWVVDVERILFPVDPSPFYPLEDPIHPLPEGYDLLGAEYRRAILSLPF